jgi:hypothetical protein
MVDKAVVGADGNPPEINEQAAFEAEVRLMAHVRAATSGNPKCGKSGCNGGGILGYSTYTGEKDKKPHVFLRTCTCAETGKNEYAMLNDQMRNVITHLGAVFSALEQANLQAMEKVGKEISGGIAVHHETMSRQIEESKETILLHMFFGLLNAIVRHIQTSWNTWKNKKQNATQKAPINETAPEPEAAK